MTSKKLLTLAAIVASSTTALASLDNKNLISDHYGKHPSYLCVLERHYDRRTNELVYESKPPLGANCEKKVYIPSFIDSSMEGPAGPVDGPL